MQTCPRCHNPSSSAAAVCTCGQAPTSGAQAGGPPPAPGSSSDASAKKTPFLFILACYAFAILFMGVSIACLGHEYWFICKSETTIGRVISEPAYYRGSRRSSYYSFRYEYSVAGQSYQKEGRSRSRPPSMPAVYYLPTDPATSTPSFPETWYAWMFLAIGSFLLWCAVSAQMENRERRGPTAIPAPIANGPAVRSPTAPTQHPAGPGTASPVGAPGVDWPSRIFWSLIVFLLGLGLVAFVRTHWFDSRMQAVTAQITSGPEVVRKGKGSAQFAFTYAYEAAGHIYEGRAVTATHPFQTMTAYYLKADPSQSCLDSPDRSVGGLCLIGIAFLFGLCALVYVLSRIRLSPIFYVELPTPGGLLRSLLKDDDPKS